MSVRTHTDFLDGDDSEASIGDGYDSEANEGSRGAVAGRSSKRRKLELDNDEADYSDGHSDNASSHVSSRVAIVQHDDRSDVDARDVREEDRTKAVKPKSKLSGIKVSTPKQVIAAQKAAQKTGVVYISRVPPFMKPQTLRHFLAPHAPKGLDHIFLTPEDHVAHASRVRRGGNKKKSYTDGWVEFKSKRDAKIAAETLNGNIIGGKKGNFYHDDIWSMKYLKGFKWSHLTEQIANENAERAARMREEVRKTREETKAFIDNVEKGKMLENMESKRKARSKEKSVPIGAVD